MFEIKHSAVRHSTAAQVKARHRAALRCAAGLLYSWADLSWACIVIQHRNTWYEQTWCSSTGTWYLKKNAKRQLLVRYR